MYIESKLRSCVSCYVTIVSTIHTLHTYKLNLCNMKIKTLITSCLVLIVILIISFMIYLIIQRVNMKDNRNENVDPDFEDIEDEDVLKKFQRSATFTNKVQNTKKIIKMINERQHIFNNENNNTVNVKTTVLVIHVHDNKSYLSIFLESISQVMQIRRSLLIFAHDYYNAEINSAIRNMKCPRIMQIFYPYSIQLHPNMYPGEDARFYEELNQFTDSKRRDPILAQTKLFWWWVANQVFDYVELLQEYDGYIYFFETEQYLARDVIHMTKMLEKFQPEFCSECQILSLGSRYPDPVMYYPGNNYLIVSIWGWSNYTNSGIGFNRTTWNEIKSHSRQFCHFKDSSWENSLKYVGAKTPQGHFYMLSTEGPRIFPTSGCGAFMKGTDCDLNKNYHDILRFMPKITYGRLPHSFKLKFDGCATKKEVEPRGQWGDARDIDLCMRFSSTENREQD